MGKKISKHQDGVTFWRIDCQGVRSTKMGVQAMGIYTGKYGPKLPACEESVEANIFANHFSVKGGKYPIDFWVEG